MSDGYIGLIGVVIGFLLSFGADAWKESRARKRHSHYLAIRVTTLLDKFWDQCLEVVMDDGTFQGQRDERDCLSPHAALPVLMFDSLDVDWKSLPAEFMYDVLALPGKAEEAKRKIGAAFEYDAHPPDYEEGFEARWYECARLGLEAIRLSVLLRNYAGIPVGDDLKGSQNWSPSKRFKDAIQKVHRCRSRRDEAHRAWSATLNAKV